MRINVTPRSRRYQVYRILGILLSLHTTVVWLATILTLFGEWGAKEHFKRHDSVDSDIIYMSSEIAVHLPGMILAAITVGIPYFLTLLVMKLYYDIDLNGFKRIISLLSVIFGLITVIALFVLSIVKSTNSKAVHYTFVGIFIYSNLLSALLTIIYRFKISQFNMTIVVRAAVIGVCIPLTISFIVIASIGMANNRSNLNSVAGSIEWSIAIVLIFYYGSFIFDLLLYKT